MANKKLVSKTYSQLNDELSAIIDWFEGQEINIDEALPKYEQAMKLIKEMEDQLKLTKNKIKKINAHFK